MAEGGYRRVEPDSAPASRQSSLSNRYTPSEWANASDETCRLMDCMGYGSHIRQAKRDGYRERGILLSAFENCTYLTVGSKGEGLTNTFENDDDALVVLNGVVCLEDALNYVTISREMTVLILNFRVCYPGHCILLLGTRDQLIQPELSEAIVDDGYGGALLSSDLFVSYFQNILPGLFCRERAGPSLPYSNILCGNCDFVFSLRCLCPSLLNRWASRPRHWPPPEVVQKVVSMGAFVTPDAFKGSENKHVEWRLCFNTGEIELMCNLNDAQIKAYVILKMIVKDVLNPKHKEITSYTVKNIVLWLAEKNQDASCHKKSLFNWLHESLICLRTAINTRHLPYYMIPERNLLAVCGMREDQQRIWIAIINDMIDEGPRVLLRLPKMRRAIIAHPQPLFLFSRMRTELEMLNLLTKIRLLQCLFNGVNVNADRLIQALHERFSCILVLFFDLTHFEWNLVNICNVIAGILT